MRFALDQQQEAFRQEVRSFLASASPEAEVRRLMASEDGFDRTTWAEFARATGGVALQAPAERGGRGGAFVETAAMLEEAGRTLFCAPLLSSVLVTQVALLADERDPLREVLGELAQGRLVATVVLPPSGGNPDVTATADRSAADGYVLNGSASYVVDGATSERLVVPARLDGAVALFDVTPGDGGLRRTRLATLDQTRKQARLDFAAVPARRIECSVPGRDVLDWLMDLTRVAVAAESIGGAAACLASAVEYTSRRHQFGRPVGSFQALKHRCADVLRLVESARSAVFYAARAADQSVTELPTLARLALELASRAYLTAAEENLQMHGGIGFTWDDSAHLHLKRAKSTALLFGQPAAQRQELAVLLGLTA